MLHMYRSGLVFSLVAGASLFFLCSAQTHQCYVCGYSDELPCSDFNASIRFVQTCPNGYHGCMTKINRTSVSRSCETVSIKRKCSNLLGVTYCYCSGSLCNGPILDNDYTADTPRDGPKHATEQTQNDELEYIGTDDDDYTDEENGYEEDDRGDDYTSEDDDGEDTEQDYDSESTDESDDGHNDEYYDNSKTEKEFVSELQNLFKSGVTKNSTNNTITNTSVTPSSPSDTLSSSTSFSSSSATTQNIISTSSIPTSLRGYSFASYTPSNYNLTTNTSHDVTQSISETSSTTSEKKLDISATTETSYSRGHHTDNVLLSMICFSVFTSLYTSYA